ncbi:MAG TPA: hypothetical protein VIY48_14005, partial [Candidatus Paceibacterota bacterium]
MTGKVLNFYEIAQPDKLGCEISMKWLEYNTLRKPWRMATEEVRKYIYATDTRTTTNSQNPWKNSTTIPKLCQIRDNLYSNYMASMFPDTKSKWIEWQADRKDDNSKVKRDAITSYMSWAVDQSSFRQEMGKMVLDYIDNGNVFGTVEWIDERSTLQEPAGTKVGYVGPTIRRISPHDIVFNPTAPSFQESWKIIRSLVSWGEVKKILESQSTSEDKQFYEDLYAYLLEIRAQTRSFTGDLQVQDAYYQVDGFTSYRAYLESDYCEILTFYGDIFDWEDQQFYPNHKIMVVDRHKVVSKKPNPSYFGYPPIFHVGWRPKQDNLWAMGPLHNLVGMQYRVDHIENMKADVLDFIAFPMQKVKGYVEDYQWQPGGKIFIGDEGDVELLMPPYQVLQLNSEIQQYINAMEEMAGAPKEAMGFRSPGEKTAYEVQRLENAASRIFQNKIVQFETLFFEPLLNAMLELARRNLSSVIEFPVFDNDFKMQVFTSLSPTDVTGAGKLRPMAARHFAEKAEMVQNISNF